MAVTSRPRTRRGRDITALCSMRRRRARPRGCSVPDQGGGCSTAFPPGGSDALRRWHAAFPEQPVHDGRHLALVPTVFDRLDPGLCRALVHRGWWLGGAALALHHPGLLPDDLTLMLPPSRG
ncbi:hypothetical protein ACWGKA_16690 [Streptomyces luteogriseus]